MYIVHIHAYGRPNNGGWETGLPRHKWLAIYESRSAKKCESVADNQSIHAVVMNGLSEKVYDNGKPYHDNPATIEGCIV